MRKLSYLFMVLLVVMLSSCSLFLNEFDEALVNMSKLDSFRMNMTMENVPFFGTVTGYSNIDGDNMYLNLLGIEQYSFVEDGTTYELIEDEDAFYAVKVFDEDDFQLDASVYKNFTSDNFIFNDEGYYEAIEDYDDFTELTVYLEDGYISEIHMYVDTDGYLMELTLEFSQYDDITVVLPDYEMMSTIDSAIYYLEQDGFVFTDLENGFMFESWFISIFYTTGGGVYQIVNDGITYYFYPGSTELELDTVSYPLSNYINDDTGFTQDMFDYLTIIYNELDE